MAKTKSKPLVVLSLFDGVSCGQYIIKKLLKCKNVIYYASEIEKSAIACTLKNWPDTIQLGDVTKIDPNKLPKIDLLIGGSPCQGFSNAGYKQQFKDPRSRLFFEYVRIYRELRKRNPGLKFLLENVTMPKQSVQIISKYMEVSSIVINSELFSPQQRVRNYWTNIPLMPLPTKPSPKMLIDILEKPYYNGDVMRVNPFRKGFMEIIRCRPVFGKSPTLLKSDNVLNIPTSPTESRRGLIVEMERLAGLPDGYTVGCGSDTKRREAIGNGWECNTVAFLLYNFIKQYL